MLFFKKKVPGSEPAGYTPIGYGALPRPQQDSINNEWPSAVTQYGARVTNAWWGNQLPSSHTFIEGVPQSYSLWSLQRNLQLTGNAQMNVTSSQNSTVGMVQSNQLSQLAGSLAGFGGVWQGKEI